MSYEQRKNNRQRREKRYKILIVVIITILIVIVLSSLFNEKVKIVLPVEDTFLNQKELQAVVIKNEKVFKLSDQKDIEKDDKEGRRIPVGTNILNSTVFKDVDLLNSEVEEVNKAIDFLENSEEDKIYKESKNNLMNTYKDRTKKLQESVYLSNYDNINNLKKEILSTEKELNELFPKDELLDKNIDSLKHERNKLVNEIDEKESVTSSTVSGIFSYKVDGFENELRAKSFDIYTFDKLKIPDLKINELGEIKEQGEITEFKIIENLEWYLALKIDNRKDIKQYHVGEDIKISYPDGKKGIELDGKIVSINNSSFKSVIIIKFNKHLYKFYNSRFPKVNLIEEKIDGFKIPSNVVVKNKDKNGVYIKDFSGIVKFKAIKIIATEGDYTYLDKGNEGMISVGNSDEIVPTISIFDEIVLEPYKFKEGQILE